MRLLKYKGKTINFGGLLLKIKSNEDIPAPDGVIMVKWDSFGNNDGSSWNNAYTSLETAISNSTSGDEIWVSKGTYYPENDWGNTGDRNKHFRLKNGVTILGGFSGLESTKEMRNYTLNQTILSGEPDDVYHVFNHTNLSLNNTAILDGFTVSKGNANGSGNDSLGGGMLNMASFGTGSSPTINNCIFDSNISTNNGGGVYNSRFCNPSFNNVTFSNNTATFLGGAMYCIRNNTSIINCDFNNNQITSTSASNGGAGIYITLSVASETINIEDCVFYENSTPIATTSNNGGSCIYAIVNPGTLNITNCDFWGNYGYYGGCVYVSAGSQSSADNSSVIIDDCEFYDNTATYGATIFSSNQNTIIKNSEFHANTAEQHGDIYLRFGLPSVLNTLIYGNKSTTHGGGIYVNNSTVDLTNLTIAGNWADYGGGVSIINGTTLNIYNSIIWGNRTGINGNTFYVSSDSTINIFYSNWENGTNDVQIETGGVFNFSDEVLTDPLFVDEVVATDLNTPNSLGNYQLQSSSPCINSGNDTYISEPYDIRGVGFSRKVGTVDMGAYEYQDI